MGDERPDGPLLSLFREMNASDYLTFQYAATKQAINDQWDSNGLDSEIVRHVVFGMPFEMISDEPIRTEYQTKMDFIKEDLGGLNRQEPIDNLKDWMKLFENLGNGKAVMEFKADAALHRDEEGNSFLLAGVTLQHFAAIGQLIGQCAIINALLADLDADTPRVIRHLEEATVIYGKLAGYHVWSAENLKKISGGDEGYPNFDKFMEKIHRGRSDLFCRMVQILMEKNAVKDGMIIDMDKKKIPNRR